MAAYPGYTLRMKSEDAVSQQIGLPISASN